MDIKKEKIEWEENNKKKTVKFELEIAVHPFNNGKIVINVAGCDGSLDGYNNKYIKLANYIVKKKLGAVVRMPNPHTLGFSWESNLRNVIEYVLNNAKEICGANKPTIYIMGFSAGAGATAILAWRYPEIKKILLLEPAPTIGETSILNSLKKFTGKVVIVTGSGKDAFGPHVGKMFLNEVVNATEKELITVDNCDHQFRGEINGRIFSQAPIYAFSKKKIKFPQQNGGIKLYE